MATLATSFVINQSMSEHRNSRFKPLVLKPEELVLEGQRLTPVVDSLWSSFEAGRITAAQTAALFFLLYAKSRLQKNWFSFSGAPLSSVSDGLVDTVEKFLGVENVFSSRDLEKFPEQVSLSHFFTASSFRCVPAAINESLTKWLKGQWDLLLTNEVPSPYEILRVQSMGGRIVTVLTGGEQLSRYVNGERDPFEFFLHDLIHAHRFNFEPQLHEDQTTFFALLLKLYSLGIFSEMEEKDPEFVQDLHYVMSDMNAHGLHMTQYLRAICIKYFLKQEGQGPNEKLSVEASRRVQEIIQPFLSTFSFQIAEPLTEVLAR